VPKRLAQLKEDPWAGYAAAARQTLKEKMREKMREQLRDA
jgi:hypothetical protein